MYKAIIFKDEINVIIKTFVGREEVKNLRGGIYSYRRTRIVIESKLRKFWKLQICSLQLYIVLYSVMY